MPMVNQFQGYGGNPGYGNWPSLTQPFTAAPKPSFDPTRPSGDCLKRVRGSESASKFTMNPNSRDVLFDENEDIFYIVTSDASGSVSVQAFSFAPYKPTEQEQPTYVTMEEFNKFKKEVLDGQQFIRNRNSRNGGNKPGGKQSVDDTE